MQEQKFTIGRDRGCDIPIADESVSRLHAQLTFTEGQQIFLTGCKSSNGTFLFREERPEPIQQEFISPEDKVQFGSVTFQVADLLVAIKKKHNHVNTDQLRGTDEESCWRRPWPWACSSSFSSRYPWRRIRPWPCWWWTTATTALSPIPSPSRT